MQTALLLLLQDTPSELPTNPTMTATSWAFMLLAWAFVIGLAAWCFSKVIWGGKPS